MTADDIVKIYEKHLDIPQSKPNPQFYVVPVGLVGAGKSTVLKPLAKKLHLLRVSGDEIRKVILDNNGDLADTWEVGRTIVEKYAKAGYSIAHDTDGATPKTQESIAVQAKKYDVQVIWIHVNPPEEFIIKKLREYNHTWLFSSSDEAIETYFKRKPLHLNVDLDFIYEFDTSKSNINEQIDNAYLAIRRKLRLSD